MARTIWNGMTDKTKRKPPPAKPRDPFWRLRRVMTEKAKPSAKVYKRGETKKKEREADRDDDR